MSFLYKSNILNLRIFRFRSDFDQVVAVADIELNNTVYNGNSSNSNSISESLTGHRPPI